MRLPARFRSFPDDDRFDQMPILWHLSGRLIPASLRRGPWWSWWVSLYVNQVEAAAFERRQNQQVDFV
jgi:hypothetical protein